MSVTALERVVGIGLPVLLQACPTARLRQAAQVLDPDSRPEPAVAGDRSRDWDEMEPSAAEPLPGLEGEQAIHPQGDRIVLAQVFQHAEQWETVGAAGQRVSL